MWCAVAVGGEVAQVTADFVGRVEEHSLGRIAIIVAACVACIGAFVVLPGVLSDKTDETATYKAPGLDPLTIENARAEFWRLTPALLLVVYEAFGKTQEADIYDTLSSVTHGEALEYLYLERVGAMADGGLDEADQTIHEIKLLNTQVSREAATLQIDASWQVIGTVGHAEHLHVRGNTYRADLSVAPIEGAWRITDFDLREVNRDAAGETFLAPEAETAGATN